MDSYFASVEQQYNQNLVGKPVGVIKAVGRTCVIAASREAKKFGVKTGVNIYEAKVLCPEIILVPSDFNKYLLITKKFIKICEKFSPYLEVFSIDELFMDVTESQKFFGGYNKMCFLIKEELKKELGSYITCSIGISYNRMLAKLASEINKPNGIFEITLDNRDEVLFSRKLTDVCGLGFGLEKRLLNMGIKNFKTLREIPVEFLEASFGRRWATYLKDLSFGKDTSNLTGIADLKDAKSVSRTFTLFEDTNDIRQVRQVLNNLSGEVGYKLRKMKMLSRQFGVIVRGDNFSASRHLTQKRFIDNSNQIAALIWDQFSQISWKYNVRFLGVWSSLIQPKEKTSLSIFPDDQRAEKLWSSVDRLNDKFGDFTIYPGTLLNAELIRPEVNGFLGDKKYQLI